MTETKALQAPVKTINQTQPTNGKPAILKAPIVSNPPKEEKAETENLSPIDERLHRLNILFDLQRKHAKLQESRKKLNEFEIAQNKENSSLELSDDEGNEFTTTNPVVIAAVVKLALQVINDKSKELEAQIIL